MRLSRLFITTGAGGQIVTVNPATETDTPASITATPGAVTVIVTATSETDTPASITATPGAVTVTINQATETDSASAVTPDQGQIITVNAASETDTPASITATPGAVTKIVKNPTETDSAAQVVPQGTPDPLVAAPYAELAAKACRRPIITATTQLDKCANTFGVAPCTATAATGAECYNTFFTCQDTANYDASTTLDLVLTSTKADVLESPAATNGDVFIPCMDSIRIAPEKITPGKGLGYRGSVTITCIDFPHHDVNIDPYVDTRTYTPIEQGTFFGKLLARNVHYVGRPLKVTQYFHGGGRTASDVRESLYIIDTIDGPDQRGLVRITAKDPLVLTEASKAQCPVASTGTLSAALAAGTTTTFSLNSGEGADYPSGTCVLRINDELIAITSRSSDTFTINARGYGGTTAADHGQDDTVQLCYVRNGIAADRVDLVLADLLQNYASVPAAYLPTTDWDTEADTWANAYYLETIISEPTSVASLLSEICMETNSDLWWSAVDQEIKWATQTPEFSTLSTFSDADFIKNSATLKSRQADRVSQVYFYHGVRNWTESLEPKNFQNLVVRIDSTGEGADAFDSPAIKKIFARWMQDTTNVGELASRYLSRFKTPPLLLTTDIDLKDIDKVVGQHIDVTTDLVQDTDGTSLQVEMQILSMAHTPGKETIRIEAMQYRFETRYFSVGPDSLGNYTAESEENTTRYGFIADTATEQMSNGDDPYLII